jgi:hypothetical protein
MEMWDWMLLALINCSEQFLNGWRKLEIPLKHKGCCSSVYHLKPQTVGLNGAVHRLTAYASQHFEQRCESE